MLKEHTGSELWNKFFTENSINNIVRPNNTYVYLKKDSIFEEENFNELLNVGLIDLQRN